MFSLKTGLCRICRSRLATRGPDCWRTIHPAHRRLAHEPLESRMLLSASPVTADAESAAVLDGSHSAEIGEICYSTAEDGVWDSELCTIVETEGKRRFGR